MIAISENLRNHGYTSSADDHTRPPGIWKKLREWYNLEALDEREDNFGYSSQSDITKEPFVDFDLPHEDYWEMTFSRRLAPGGTSSPAVLPFQISGVASTRLGRHSTVDDSEGLDRSICSFLASTNSPQMLDRLQHRRKANAVHEEVEAVGHLS